MGLFSFVFDGGNVGLIAKSIAMHHKRLGDFDKVSDFYHEDFLSRPKGSKNYERAQEAIFLFLKGQVNNYCDLAILALMVDAAPAHYTFYDVKQDFSERLVKHLLKNGLDMNHISGSPSASKRGENESGLEYIDRLLAR
jgi:hypothetical protein